VANYYVICITKKPNHADRYTKIQAYGVSTRASADEGAERWSEQKMIDIIEKGEHVVKSWGPNPKTGQKEFAILRVITKSDGSKYVKSENDGDKPDNLLQQRECDSRDA
jgi:hypothetical protein